MKRIEKLEDRSYVSTSAECGEGWNWILNEMFNRIDPLITSEMSGFRIVQIKEKWGILRVYCNFSTIEIDNIIEDAEDSSVITCENCGDTGKHRPGGWVKTLCDKCYSLRRNK